MTHIPIAKGVSASTKSYGDGPLGVYGQGLTPATQGIKQKDMESDCIGQCATLYFLYLVRREKATLPFSDLPWMNQFR